MTAGNAIDWHTQIATDFDEKYSNSKNFRERYTVWTEILSRYSNNNFHVLDVGCGSGAFTFFLAERNKSVIGVDGSAEMLRICETKKKNLGSINVDFINSDVGSLGKHLDEKSDLVICSSVLEYLDDLDGSLEQIVRSMKKNSLLIFSMPNKQSIYRKTEPILFHLFGRPRYYKYVRNVCTLKEIETKLQLFGFSILESKYYGATPLLSMLCRKVGVPFYSDNLFITVARFSP